MSLMTKFITVCAAIVVSLTLVATFAGVDALAPKGSLLGFIVRAAVLVCTVPFALIVFNALCDKLTLPRERRAGDEVIARSSTVRKDNSIDQIDSGRFQIGSAVKWGAATRDVRESATPTTFPLYDSIRFSVSAPTEKWWVGQ